MNKTQIIYTVLFGVILVLFSYIIILQPKVNAGNEILEIQQRLQELDTLEQEAKDNWHIAEDEKQYCVMSCQESWGNQQQKESDLAEGYRTEKKNLENRLGLLLSRQAQ